MPLVVCLRFLCWISSSRFLFQHRIDSVGRIRFRRISKNIFDHGSWRLCVLTIKPIVEPDRSQVVAHSDQVGFGYPLPLKKIKVHFGFFNVKIHTRCCVDFKIKPAYPQPARLPEVKRQFESSIIVRPCLAEFSPAAQPSPAPKLEMQVMDWLAIAAISLVDDPTDQAAIGLTGMIATPDVRATWKQKCVEFSKPSPE